jgi:DNA invertase Pin-like site-specific DNA recombinase
VRRAYLYSRFSQERQADGDSLRRQSDLAKAYCEKHGLILDGSTLADLGVSAWTGDNASGGELGAFLQAVDDGKVRPGSALIIENIDRLSRLPPIEANKILERVLKAGVSLVTTSPEREYTKDNISSFGIWIELQVSMQLAHEESAKKSKRLREVWAEKRKKVGTRKLTTVAPSWLKPSADGTAWVVREDVAAIVRRMFALALDGHGLRGIAAALHEEHPSGLRGRGWHTWTIDNILRSRSVLGEFQPHTGRSAKNGRKSTRKPLGDPIPNYFPAIIPEADFYGVEALLNGRRRAGGRLQGVPNLFAGLLCDARDGKSLVINASSGKRHLVSSGAIRKQRGAVYRSFPYAEFEAALLALFRELKVADVLPSNGHEDKMSALSGKLAAVNHKLAAVRRRADEAEDDIGTFLDMIADYERDKKTLAAELEKARAAAAGKGGETLGELQSLAEVHDKTTGPERDSLRLRIKARVRQLVEEISVLVVVRSRCHRLAAVQVWFSEGKKHRDYLIYYQAAGHGRKGGWHARSLADVADPAALDLRKPGDAAALERVLAGLDLGRFGKIPGGSELPGDKSPL